MRGHNAPSIIAARYQVLGEIGRGGFGRVYRVQHLRTGEILALKVLHKPTDNDATAIERFQREARAPALIRSEHVVRVTDADIAPELDDAPFLVMELLEGIDLQQHIVRHGQFPSADVIEILRQVARALDKAHAAGIIHRDLKPANVYLHRSESGVVVKLLDFGISKMANVSLLESDAATMTATGAAIGTPLYMSPEQALGRSQDMSPAADIWSTGMLAFTLLVGRPYFTTRAIGELMVAIIHEPLLPPSQHAPELPPAFDTWFARSCNRDPAQRWPTAGEQIEALAAALGVPASTRVALSLPHPAPTESAQPPPPAPRSGHSRPQSGSLDVQRGITRGGERRQITVLFLSLRPTLETAEEVDPEELVDVISTCKAACEPHFDTFGAPLTRAVGDGILAYFGYPVAYGDDAWRAVSAGLQLLQELTALAARLHQERRVSIAVRVSVHTGLVAIHEGTPEGSSIIGQAIEVPRGLEHLVPANTVVMSGATERLVRGRFDCSPLLAPGQIPAYRVHRPHIGAPIDSRPGSPIPLIGRDIELALLQERWEEAQSRQGQVVLLLGDAGMGKSSLLRTFRRRLQTTLGPGQWLESQCTSLYQHTALQPLIDLLQRALGYTPDQSSDQKLARLDELVQKAHLPADASPLLARLLSLPLRSPPLNLSPQRQKQKTHEALLGWLHAQATDQPLCLAIEDLHWADASTLELLGTLIAQSTASRLLLLLTARPEFTVPWRSHAHLATINLPRLPQRRIETLIQKLTGGKALPPELLAQLIEKTDGVPLFIEELTRAVLESGQLRDTGERYTLDSPLPAFTIPSTLRDSLSARLDRLGPAKLTAQLAAVIGREFDRDLLAAISPADEGALEEHLQRLVDSDLVYRKPPAGATCAFKHSLIHEAAYDSLLKPTRRQAHQRIAAHLTERHPQLLEAQPELIAHHHASAGQPAQAAPLYLAAARRALARQAHIEARAQLERGLALLETLPQGPDRMRLELELRITLGVPLMVTRGYGAPEVEANYVRALELGQTLGATRNLLTPLWGLWIFYHVRARYRTAHDLTDQLLQAVAHETDPGQLLCAHLARGATTAKMGHFEEAQRHLEQTLALYDPARHRAHAHLYGQDPSMFARVMLSWVLWLTGQPDRALHVVEEAVTLAAGLSHPNSLAFALYMSGVVHQFRGAPERSLQRAQELLALAREQALVHWIGLSQAIHGWSLAHLGEIEAGLTQLRDGVRAWQMTGARASRAYWTLALAETYATAGQFDEALTAVREAQAFIEETAEREFAAEAHRIEGELLAQTGHTEAALTSLERARQTAAAMGARSLELRAALSLALRSQDPGQRETARAHLETLYRAFVTENQGLETADLRTAHAFLTDATQPTP